MLTTAEAATLFVVALLTLLALGVLGVLQLDVWVKKHTRDGRPVDEYVRRRAKDLVFRRWLAVLLGALLVVFLLSGGQPPELGWILAGLALACLVLTVR